MNETSLKKSQKIFTCLQIEYIFVSIKGDFKEDGGSAKTKKSRKLSQALPMNSMSKRRTEAGGMRHEPAKTRVSV